MTARSRVVTVPVFFYLAVTLGVPVVRGAASHRGFLAHAGTLLFVVTAVSAAWAWLQTRARCARMRGIGVGTRPARP